MRVARAFDLGLFEEHKYLARLCSISKTISSMCWCVYVGVWLYWSCIGVGSGALSCNLIASWRRSVCLRLRVGRLCEVKGVLLIVPLMLLCPRDIYLIHTIRSTQRQ